MGTDIHMLLETEKSVNSKKVWVNIDYWQHNHYYGLFENEPYYTLVSIYEGRNYELFGILAGVRNNTCDKIDDPRGIPSDISEMTRKEYDRQEYKHSESYLTLRELNEHYKKNPTIENYGFVPPEEYEKVKKNENHRPRESCFWTSNDTWVEVTWFEESPLKRLINEINKRIKKEFYLFDDTRLDEYQDSVRIVFWFDS